MLNIMRQELKYYFNNTSELIYIYSYFISISLLVPFVGAHESAGQPQLAVLALWVALASAVAIGAQGLFRRDQEQGLLEYYQLLPVALELTVFAKWLSFYIFILLPMLATLPVAGLLLNLTPTEMAHDAVGLSVGAVGLTILSTLTAALVSGLEKAGAVLSLLILPLSIPILIFGAAYCRDVSGASSANLMLMLGFAIFMLPIMCWIGASSIRASN